MRIATLKLNDVANGEGVSVSLFTQGCPHHCKNCFNPETWDAAGGTEIDREELLTQIIEAIGANGIQRNFSVLGGEPLASYNLVNTHYIIKNIREKYPTIKIYIWTGYTLDELIEIIAEEQNDLLLTILQYADVLIDGRFVEDLKDITLKLRGSSNQQIHNLKEIDIIKKIWYNKIKKEIKNESKS